MKLPQHKGTKNKAINKANHMIDFSQNRGLKLRGSEFLLFLPMVGGVLAFEFYSNTLLIAFTNCSSITVHFSSASMMAQRSAMRSMRSPSVAT